MSRRVLGIDGIDGSGKSTFSRRLLEEVRRRGGTGVVIRVDDFRRPVDWSRGDAPEPDLYYDEYYDFALLERCLRAFRDGAATFAAPVFQVQTERLEGTAVLDLGAELALVEGVFPLRCAAVREDALVYLRTSPETARRRILARDQRRGRSREDVEHRIARRYFPGQARYHALFDPEGHAQAIVDNEEPTAPVLVRCDDRALPEGVVAALRALVPAGT